MCWMESAGVRCVFLKKPLVKKGCGGCSGVKFVVHATAVQFKLGSDHVLEVFTFCHSYIIDQNPEVLGSFINNEVMAVLLNAER